MTESDYLNKYEELLRKNLNEMEIDLPSELNLLPIAMKVVPQTIGLNLVPVVPMTNGPNDEALEKIKNEVKSVNRDNKIDSLIDGSEFNEMKVEDHPDYSKSNSGLFYIDYMYDTLNDVDQDTNSTDTPLGVV